VLCKAGVSGTRRLKSARTRPPEAAALLLLKKRVLGIWVDEDDDDGDERALIVSLLDEATEARAREERSLRGDRHRAADGAAGARRAVERQATGAEDEAQERPPEERAGIVATAIALSTAT
jgi:hypothetical protein